MPRPIRAIIDTQAMRHNLDLVIDRVRQEPQYGDAKVMAVIKAHAYGHGIAPAVKAFARADGLAMIDMDEATRCRELGWEKPLMLLEGFFDASDIPVMDHARLIPVLHNQEQLDMLAAHPPKQPIDAFMNLNTGLHRLGFQPHEYRAAYTRALALQQQGILGRVGKMTHFACAEDDPAFTQEQIDRLNRITADLPGPMTALNTPATLTPGFAARIPAEEHWHRPGICLYGSSPFDDKIADDLDLKPAMTLRTQVLGVHTLPAGAGISYGLMFRAEHDMRVGIIACGFADGYPRHAPTGTPITVDGVKTRIIGRIAMDMMAVDLDPVSSARVGSEVIAWGAGGPTVDTVAQAAGTIADELITGLAQRVPREIL